jgi:mannosyl-3-phosphoglycerate phosphatase
MKRDAFPDEGKKPHRRKSRISGVSDTPFFVIFTDLDGTLLDHDTYEWECASPALALCKGLNVPVVLASSKTRAEMDVLRRKLSISWPFISENGGGIFFPTPTVTVPPPHATLDKDLWRWSIGLPYTQLVRGLQEIRSELGIRIRGFSEMDLEEISSLTGLDIETSALAAQREYDEPFIRLEKRARDDRSIMKAAGKRGFRVTAGGRFYHLHGNHDKGLAMRRLLSWYRQFRPAVVSIALGDSPNDLPMLENADLPILVRSDTDPKALGSEIPNLRVTHEKGPRGWNSAILGILGDKRGI